MPRFFVPPEDILEDSAYIRGQDARHVAVLRIRAEERFVLCDGRGTDYVCRLLDQREDLVTAEILEKRPSAGEPTLDCAVYAGFPKGDKAESIVQKAVELGASGIYFFPAANCTARPDEKSLKKKLERLDRVALEAAKQCGRGRVPPVGAFAAFSEALEAAAARELPLFFWEGERTLHLREALVERPGFRSAAVFTGPEGGFCPEEADSAVRKGLKKVSLGPRILRCETAPLCALAALMYESGNL